MMHDRAQGFFKISFSSPLLLPFAIPYPQLMSYSFSFFPFTSSFFIFFY